MILPLETDKDLMKTRQPFEMTPSWNIYNLCSSNSGCFWQLIYGMDN